MPLVSALLKFSSDGRSSWHTPAHNAGQAWPTWLKLSLPELDVTELPLTDDINRPKGPASQAMQLAARAFGAGLTRFITSGSTTALQIMLAACVGRGGQLLLPRCVHQSIVHAAALLDLELHWLPAESLSGAEDSLSLLPRVTPENVAATLTRYPTCRALLLTAPDYYGQIPDVVEIARIAHAHGALLLVDEAHGAHLAFGPGVLPPNAIQSGADACVQSGHKTLPVLTPGAYLHVSRDALAAGRILESDMDRLIPVFQTSSPSFPIAATLDYARAWASAHGHEAICRQMEFLAEFTSTLPSGFVASPVSMRCGPGNGWLRDPLRLVLTQTDCSRQTAVELAVELARSGIDVEFADLTRLVMIPSLLQTEADWHRLTAALRSVADAKPAKLLLPGQHCREGTAAVRLAAVEKEWRLLLTLAPESVLTPGEALLRRCQIQRLPLAKAAGKISARAILPYPPGIPLIWPGERLDQDRVDFLRRLLENNISVTGIDQENLWVIT